MSMFYKMMQRIREKYHPLFYLKGKLFFRNISRFFDIPVSLPVYGINWKVRIRLIRHLSWIINPTILEPEVSSLFLAINRLLKPRVFWDIGANIGYYSWLLMSHNENIEVVLLEPDPDNASLLRQTIKRAGLINTRVIDSAACDKNGKEPFVVDPVTGAVGAFQSANMDILHRWYGLSKSITVETITLDSMLEEGLRPPELIKIDVEGATRRVFKGAMKLIKENQPIIIFECFPSEQHESVLQLEDSGYNVSRLDSFYNFLALPSRYANFSNALDKAWGEEFKAWQKSYG